MKGVKLLPNPPLLIIHKKIYMLAKMQPTKKQLPKFVERNIEEVSTTSLQVHTLELEMAHQR